MCLLKCLDIILFQSIVVYEWLPALLGEAEPLPQYSGKLMYMY